MVDPVVCVECGKVQERVETGYCDTEFHFEGFSALCDGEQRPLPEPWDPDLGALHGVGTMGGCTQFYAGPASFEWTFGDDPTGELAFLRSVGEE